MRKELEYAKKMVLVCKLFRDGLLSEKEFFKVKTKLMDMYYVAEIDTFADRIKIA